MTTFVSIFRRSYSVAKQFATEFLKKHKSHTDKQNKHNPMKDRMSTISTYLDKARKMDSMNESVIICDAITPGTKGLKKRTKQNIQKGDLKKTVDSNRKLSNVQMRLPLRTVYESPLDHRVHNTCKGNSSVVVNLAAKRLRNNQDTKIQPPVKKQKINNCNETIIIVSDDEPEPSMSSRSSDIVLLGDAKKKIPKTKPTKSPKMKKKKRRSLRIQEQKKGTNATKPAASKDDEEIAVIWSSTCGGTNERVNETFQSAHPTKEMFFVDTTGDDSNHKKISLQDPVMCPPKTSKHPNQGPVVKKSNPTGKNKLKDKLREIIVDGCNVAIGHSHSNTFSKMGLQLVYDYFRKKGHIVKIFLPQHQRRKGREYLEDWYRRGDVVFTPSRQVGGKHIVSYDDRFIVEYATKCKGIIVTSDQYRDLWNEKPEWRETIEKQLIAPTFVGDYVMFPEDPLGRKGPKLNEFLRH